jgi:bla regulator protein blaR1
MRRPPPMTVLLAACAIALHAQSDGSARFDVVSIKRSANDRPGGGRTLPDGTQIMVGFAIRNILMAGATEPVIDVEGYPAWVASELYDITAKPPEGYERRRAGEMMRNMLIDRMKFAAHIERREQNTFVLVLARSDGKLGPQIQPSTIDCRRGQGISPSSGPPASPDDVNTCLTRMGFGTLQGGSLPVGAVAQALRMGAGALVEDRTGLQGFYRVDLKYRPTQLPGGGGVDDLPDVFTAVQEQLGMRLVPVKTMQSILVVDHIERPTEN